MTTHVTLGYVQCGWIAFGVELYLGVPSDDPFCPLHKTYDPVRARQGLWDPPFDPSLTSPSQS